MTTVSIDSMASSPDSMLADARALVAAGLCVIPVSAFDPDPTKAPKRPALNAWLPYQHRLPTDEELQRWFTVVDGRRQPFDCGRPIAGAGLVSGAISGDLCIDFDLAERYVQWRSIVDSLLPDVIRDHCVVVRTPRPGVHVHVHCATPPHNEALARRLEPALNGKPQQLRPTIETRGEGGYVLTPHCLPCAHPTGRAYTYDTDDRTLLDLSSLTPIDADDLAVMLEAARQLDETPASMRPRERAIGGLPPAGSADPVAIAAARAELEEWGISLEVSSRWDVLPGADYDAKATVETVLALVERHGAALALRRGDVAHVRRPGKDHGSSATIGYVRSQTGAPCLRVFSTSWHPFETRSYTPFAVYAMLEHGGDFKAACAALAEKGYGVPRESAAGERVLARLREALRAAQERADSAAKLAEAVPSEANQAAARRASAQVKRLATQVDEAQRDDFAGRKSEAREEQKRADAEEAADMGKAADEAAKGDLDNAIAKVSKLLGIPVVGLLQQRAEDANYFLQLEGDVLVPLGPVQTLQKEADFEAIFAMWFGRFLPEAVHGQKLWRRFSNLLLSIRTVEEAEIDGVVRGEAQLQGYLARNTPTSKQDSARDWNREVEAGRPVYDGDDLCITASHFRDSLLASGDRQVDERAVWGRLRRLSFEYVALHYTRASGERTTAGYYRRPAGPRGDGE